MQTGREVIDCLLRRKPAERVGVVDSPWGDTLKKWVTQGYPVDEKGEPVKPSGHFNFDLAGCGGGVDWHPIMGMAEIVQETDEWKIVRNGSGAQLKWWKNKSGTPEHIAFDMASREVWETKYRPHVIGTAEARAAKNIENIRKDMDRHRAAGRAAYFGSQFIWENMRGSMGDVTLYESMVLDPGWIHDYCRVYTDLLKECFRIGIERAGKPDHAWLYEDLGYKGATFCSPKCYRELIFPYFAEMVGFFHSHDVPVVLHTCGFTEPIIDLVVEAGFDGLNPMEVKAGNDPLRIAEKYADKLCFIGGLDARVLESHDRDLIRAKVGELIDGMKARGASYVYASDHSLSTNIDYQDFQFALEVYREHMWY
jgi:uroporphyrinogen decarboxylase